MTIEGTRHGLYDAISYPWIKWAFRYILMLEYATDSIYDYIQHLVG